MRHLVRLYPRAWRDRHGRELAELLAASPRPWRDGINVALFATIAWLEVPLVRVTIVVSALITLVSFAFTVGQLAGGVQEVPQHWWSSAAAAMAAGTLGASIAVLRRSRPRWPAGRSR